MSVSDPEEKIEWGAGSEPRNYERVPSSGLFSPQNKIHFPFRFAQHITITFLIWNLLEFFYISLYRRLKPHGSSMLLELRVHATQGI